MINENELSFVVDQDNEPLEPKPRWEVHKKGYWHRISCVWIVNSKNQILCQERSMEVDRKPGFWEPFFGGHLLAGEDNLGAAVAECNEELGLNIKKENLSFFKTFRVEYEKEFISTYKLNWSGDAQKINYEKDEVSQVKWMDIKEVRGTLLNDKKPNWTILGFEKEIFDWLEK
jgi:isopentenyl-diphosphate Delta-isomerase